MRCTWVFVSVVAASLSGCGGGGGADDVAKVAPPAREKKASDFTSAEGNFSINMPGNPQFLRREVPSPAGPIQMNTYLCEGVNETSYSLTYSDYSAEIVEKAPPEVMLDSALGAMRATPGWNMQDPQPVAIKDHPGREVRFTAHTANAAQEGVGLVRLYLVGNRLYQLLIVGRASQLTLQQMDDYVRSFALLKEVPVRPVSQVQREPTRPAPAPAPEPLLASGGASIVSFQWLDEKEDVIGGHGYAGKPDGTKDQHFRLALALPDDTVIEALTITSGVRHRWVTKPTPGLWPIAVFRNGAPVSKTHVEHVGTFAGKAVFDLYFNTGMGIGPGTPFNLAVDLTINGKPHQLRTQIERPVVETVAERNSSARGVGRSHLRGDGSDHRRADACARLAMSRLLRNP